MIEQIEAVEAFHKAFGVENFYYPDVRNLRLANLRFELMKEENEEYLDAAQNKDIVGIADALGDQLYILCGTILSHGLQDLIIPVFEEIQRSNMSKLDEAGKPIINGLNGVLDNTKPTGKVLKSNQYTPPNLLKIFQDKGILS